MSRQHFGLHFHRVMNPCRMNAGIMRCTQSLYNAFQLCPTFFQACPRRTQMCDTLQLDGEKLPALEDKVMKQVLHCHFCALIKAFADQTLQVQGLCRYDFDNNMAVLKLCGPSSLCANSLPMR